MRHLAMGLAVLAALPVAAQAANSAWGTFAAGGSAGVGVVGSEGAQLMIKCDKAGEKSVYAIVTTRGTLVPPSERPVLHPVKIRFDGKPPVDDRWRFVGNTAAAVNAGNEASLTRFLGGLNNAESLELEFYADPARRTPTTVKFGVAGAKDAIAQAFSTCHDHQPA